MSLARIILYSYFLVLLGLAGMRCDDLFLPTVENRYQPHSRGDAMPGTARSLQMSISHRRNVAPRHGRQQHSR
jgi:hypothetical protein